MNKPRSIKQNPSAEALPNFRNLGVVLRILLLGNLMMVLYAFAQARNWNKILNAVIETAPLFTPVFLTILVALWLLQPRLSRLSFRQGVRWLNGLVVTVMVAIYLLGGDLFHPHGTDDNAFDMLRFVLLSLVTCNTLLLYFRVRARVLAVALHEARMQVLRARIRPHFLFNTLNTVLAIVRSQPKLAETALEDLADLFRVAMAEMPDLVPLAGEIVLSEQYLALEAMRLGQRLQVEWQREILPDDVLIPPFMLQPLLENAVYHGVEPDVAGGRIQIALAVKGKRFTLRVENSCPPQQPDARRGNRMALKNIRERLALLFDVEADYRVVHRDDFYRVTITLPYPMMQE